MMYKIGWRCYAQSERHVAMNEEGLDTLLSAFNPWWRPEAGSARDLPDYERSIVAEILGDLRDLPRMISVRSVRWPS